MSSQPITMAGHAGTMPRRLAELRSRIRGLSRGAELARAQLDLGGLLSRAGEHAEALVVLEEAAHALDLAADERGLCEALLARAAILVLGGDRVAAWDALAEVRRRSEVLGAADVVARLEIGCAEAALHAGDLEGARRHWSAARPYFEASPSPADLARIDAGCAVAAARGGDPASAARLSLQAIEEATSAGDPAVMGWALRARAEVLGRGGDVVEAQAHYERAVDCFKAAERGYEVADTLLAYGLFLGRERRSEPPGARGAAAQRIAAAQRAFVRIGCAEGLERVRNAFGQLGRRGTDRVTEPATQQLVKTWRDQWLRVRGHARQMTTALQAAVGQGESGALVDSVGLVPAMQSVAAAERALGVEVERILMSEEHFFSVAGRSVVERDRVRALLDATRTLAGETDLAKIAAGIAQLTPAVVGAERAAVALLDENDGLRVRATSSVPQEEVPQLERLLNARRAELTAPTLAARATIAPRTSAAKRESTRGSDAPKSEQRESRPEIRDSDAMVCPLGPPERLVGFLYCDRLDGTFSDEEKDWLALVATHAGELLRNARQLEELRMASWTRARTLDAISDGVLHLGASGQAIAINAVAARLLGVAPDAARFRLESAPQLAFLREVIERREAVEERVVRLRGGECVVRAHPLNAEGGATAGLIATLTEVRRAASQARAIVTSAARYRFEDIIGESKRLKDCLKLAAAAARSDSTVLITGESGTGKEMVAQAIHNASSRGAGPFVDINCAAIPRELLESELFGYEEGAFTGARRRGKLGRFDLAAGGTILLDEIGEMPLEMQAKLLRVIEERRVSRLGGTNSSPIDVRIIATTNRDLLHDAEHGRFRSDLLFRLRVVHIRLPPLRERRDDIPGLVSHLLRTCSAALGRSVQGVSPAVMDALVRYPWPGNVRELAHVLEGEVNLAAPEQTALDSPPVAFGEPPTMPSWTPSWPAVGAGAEVETVHFEDERPTLNAIASSERQVLVAALTARNGDVAEAARELGIPRSTLYYKLRKLGIDAGRYRRRS